MNSLAAVKDHATMTQLRVDHTLRSLESPGSVSGGMTTYEYTLMRLNSLTHLQHDRVNFASIRTECGGRLVAGADPRSP